MQKGVHKWQAVLALVSLDSVSSKDNNNAALNNNRIESQEATTSTTPAEAEATTSMHWGYTGIVQKDFLCFATPD